MNRLAAFGLLLCLAVDARALGGQAFVSFTPQAAAVSLGDARIVTDGHDFPGVLRAAADLKADIAAVTGHAANDHGDVVIVGTLGRSALIDQLAAAGKLDTHALHGQWEAWRARW